MSKEKLLLTGIIVIALFLRLWQIGSNPPSLNWDEAAWGYNAYSLGIDGRDEFGKFLPYKYLESYGDFKPPLYAYLTIIPVKIFGLNEFAVRFPSAFFGSLTVALTYFLVLEIFIQNEKSKKFALLSAFFMAVSPWHINLSRAAFEANVASFFLILGVYLFLFAIRTKKMLLPFSVISFGLSLYTFNTSRIVAPLLGALLVAAFYKNILKRKKEALIALGCGFVLIVPITGFLLSPQASLRFKEVNIFSDISVIWQTNQEIANDNNSTLSKVIHNRRLAYGVSYLKHYLDMFNPSFLFIRGDQNPRFSTQEVGQMYILDLPLLLIGIFALFRKRFGYWWLIPTWMLIGIIPSAVARETPHALRTETTLPTFQIFASIGAVYFLIWAKKFFRYQKVIVAAAGIAYLFFVFYYLQGYYRYYPKEFSKDWQYGYKQSVLYADSVKNKYATIQATTDLGRPYIYYLLYLKIPPQEFRKNSKVRRDTFGFVYVDSFKKYQFTDTLDARPKKGILYIQAAEKVPANARVLKEFKLLNGSTVLKAYTL